MTRRLLVGVLLALATLLVAPGASAASGSVASTVTAPAAGPSIGPDCKGEPPLPSSPYGHLGLKPPITNTADPFTTPGVSLASVYGTNYRWWWYDNGCGAGSDIMPALVTNVSNLLGLEVPGLLVNLGQGLFNAVIDPSGWIGVLDKPVADATQAVAIGVWLPFLSIALLLVAVVVLFRAAQGRLSATITASVWALTILVLVTWTVGYPTESVKMLDSGIQTAVVTSAQGFAPQAEANGPPSSVSGEQDGRAQALAAMDAQWDTMNRSTLYRSWLQGVFGSADSPTAARFGPALFHATHFSWAEYDTYVADPAGAGKAIVDRKAGEFRQLAEQLAAADPVAYQFFTGNRMGDRLGTAVLSLVVVVMVSLFFLAAGLLVVLGYGVARLIVPATPAAGVFFLLDSFRDLALSWGQRIVKFLVMGPLAFLASLVLFAFNAAIFTAAMPDPLKYLFVTALAWLAWRLMRPSTAFGRMRLPGKRLLGQAAAMRFAVRRSSSTAQAEDDEGDSGEQRPSARPVRRGDRPVHTRSRPALATSWRSHKSSSGPPSSAQSQNLEREGARTFAGGSLSHGAFAARTHQPTGVDARTQRRRSGELGWQPAGARTVSEDAVASVPPLEHLPMAEDPSPAPTRVFRAGSSASGSTGERPGTVVDPDHVLSRAGEGQSSKGLLPGRAVLQGRLLADGEPVPDGVHESNLSYDAAGNQVFMVYRPQGSQVYAQDE